MHADVMFFEYALVFNVCAFEVYMLPFLDQDPLVKDMSTLIKKVK